MTTKSITGVCAVIASIVLFATVPGQHQMLRAQAQAQGAPASGKKTMTIKSGDTATLSDFKKFGDNAKVYNANGTLSTDQLAKALKDGSNIFIQGTLVIDGPPGSRAADVLIADTVTIDVGGKIELNANAVSIFAGQFITNNNASIVSFEGPNKKAQPAPPQNGR